MFIGWGRRKAPLRSRLCWREFDFNFFQRSAALIQKAHGSLPTVLLVDHFEDDDVDALLQRDFALVGIEHQSARFTKCVYIHAVEVDSALIVAGDGHDYVGTIGFAPDLGG